MACIEPEILGRYFDDELAPEQRADVERHVCVCVACACDLAELASLRDRVAHGPAAAHEAVPAQLWPAIAQHLEHMQAGPTLRLPARRTRLRRWAAAAALALILGAALIAVFSISQGEPARATVIDFSTLLDAVNVDAVAAFDGFLRHNQATPIDAAEVHRAAPGLDFEVPAELPGGFVRKQVYRLRFGPAEGIAAAYYHADGEFLATIFHPPVRQEQFGTHQDYPCAIGHHRGHAVHVGAWRMVHLTDPTTCHCVLARATADDTVSAILRAIAPRSAGGETHNH